MTNDVFFNGVPHSVQTSELTKNAINPRNTFIDNEKNELADSSAKFEKHDLDPIKALQIQTSSPDAQQPKPNYPTTKDSFASNEFLSVSKTHLTSNSQKVSSDRSTESENFYESLHKVEDRIQNLRKKHPSQNIQQLDRHNINDSKQSISGAHRFDDNMQTLHQKSFSENRQLIDEKTVGDNFQKLALTEYRRDNILYKEKKNIHEKFQQIEEPKFSRQQAVLNEQTQSVTNSELNADLLHVDGQVKMKSVSIGQSVEDDLAARVRKMKENIGRVNRTLTDIEEDK